MPLTTFEEQFFERIDGSDGTVVLNHKEYNAIQSDALQEAARVVAEFPAENNEDAERDNLIYMAILALKTQITK